MSNNRFSISEITTIIQAERISGRHDDKVITALLTDSRNLSTVESCLFFALVSARNDGHKYIEELYRKGVRHFVVQYVPEEMQEKTAVDFLVVENTLDALQQLAAAHRKRFTIPVAGITGSNGKTIVKEWLAYLLAGDKKVVKSPKSYNSQIGVPLSVWEMKPGDDIALFEAGMSQSGEMERNQKVIQPTIGIFTNVGAAHDEHFTTRDEKIKEKLTLFKGVEKLIYCIDHIAIRQMIINDPVLKNVRTFTWGSAPDSTLQVLTTKVHEGTTTIEAVYKTEKITLTIPFQDNASIENAMHCWAFLIMMGYPQSFITARMRTLPVIEMRMELKEAINNCSVINDSYSSDYNSLQIAIDFLNRQQQHAAKTIILSDILQSGRDEDELYTEVARLLEAKNINRLIGIGPHISAQADKFTLPKSFYPDTDTFLKAVDFSDFQDEAILLKGARAFALEKIDNALQQKAHETVLAINLNALAHNLNYFRSKLQPGTRLMAMVKAFSYGSGSFEIANLLQFHQVDYLAVAYADEGVELRKAGITMPVMVMNPEEQSLDKMFDYELEPEIYSFRVLELLRNKAKNGSPISIHLKLDTGMHRLGLEEKDQPRLLEVLHAMKNTAPFIRMASVFSHLAASDNPSHDTFTRQQIITFRRMSSAIQAVYDYPVMCHILNSAGIVRFPEAQLDMVRLGIGLYGIGANDHEQKQLQNVSTLKTVISQIKQINPGDTVGYDRNYPVMEPVTIGIIPIGYADGLNRRFGNGRGKVFVNGKPAGVIGNVCMDMCMINLTGIAAKENDEVVIFGEKQSITEVAGMTGTIPYEVLTSVSRRVKRVYYQE